MKKLITLTAMLFTCIYTFGQQPQKEREVQTEIVYDTIKEQGKLDKNGKRTGKWKYYYQNRQLKALGKYKQGKKEGKWKYYHDYGFLQNAGKYKNGEKTGKWKSYHENGQLRTISEYRNNTLNGKYRYYNEDGL